MDFLSNIISWCVEHYIISLVVLYCVVSGTWMLIDRFFESQFAPLKDKCIELEQKKKEYELKLKEETAIHKKREAELTTTLQKAHESVNYEKHLLQKEFEKKEQQMKKIVSEKLATIERKEEEIKNYFPTHSIISKSASLLADINCIVFDNIEYELRTKKHKAIKAADQVKELKEKYRECEIRYKEMLYTYELLMSRFPELRMYAESIEELMERAENTSLQDVSETYDRVHNWLNEEEYKALDENQRNQLALDRWKESKNKSLWQIGIEYEMYIGHLYRSAGWKVVQFGEQRGLEDLGRDIIARKVSNGQITIDIVQCKRWSQNSTIHENAICQLYGTAKKYELENRFALPCKVRPVFVTTAKLTDTAMLFANALGVIVKVVEMGDFPCIKCNINETTHEKIYHLPFDQQYHTTHIKEKGEFYALTVKEAIERGFRRAKRHFRVA